MGVAKILIVEDMTIVAMDIKENLIKLGYQVLDIISTGEGAVSYAIEHCPDLILMDIKLKNMVDGISAAKAILEEIDVPIVFLTSYSDQETLERAMGVKSYGYIIKPFESRNLLSTIEMALHQHRQEKVFHEKLDWLLTILNSIGDAVIAADEQGQVTFINPTAQFLTGWSASDAMGKDLNKIFVVIDENTGQLMEDQFIRVMNEGSIFCPTSSMLLLNRSGERIPIDNTVAPIKNAKGVITGAVIVFRDCSERRKAEAEINYLSFHDKLTGLYNRAYFEDQMRRLDTERQLPISIIMGDLNNLKLTNDAFGHNEGDKLLSYTAEVLRNTCRREDVVARWAGDEFTILLPQTEEKVAWAICERITRNCSLLPADPIRPSIALGVASKTSLFQDMHEVMSQAEDKMYRNKLLNMKEIRNSVIASLVKALEELKVEPEGHSWRMQQLAVDLGYFMGLSDYLLDELVLAVALHDIGKITIPIHILQKGKELNSFEMEILQKYPEKGYRLVNVSDELSHIAPIILSVQERWDGKGYPQGAKGEEIPLLARIIAVINVYDLLTNQRIYKPAVSSQEALAELERYSGSQFDHLVVTQFVKMIQGQIG